MSRYIRVTVIFVSAFLIHASLVGDNSSAQAFSRLQVVGLALQGNKTLQAARTLIEQAEARRSGAGLRSSPEITFNYSSDWVLNDEGQTSMGVGFEQRFPVTKRLSILQDLAEVEIELARAEVRNQERLMAREVELLCNEIAYIDAELGLRHSLVENDKEFAAFVESRIETAEASPIEANQVRIELYILEQEIEHLETDRTRLLENLRAKIGFEVGERITLSHRLDLGRAAPEFTDFSLEDLDTHPEYQLRTLMLEVADMRESLALASRWDDISLGLGYREERSIDEPIGIGNERFLGVSVSIPLPLKKRNESRLKESLLERQQMLQMREAVSLDLRSKARAMREEASHLYHQSLEFQEKITSLVELNLKEMAEAYGAGQVSLNEVFRSQSQRLKIQSAHLEMVRDYEQALVEWRAAVAKNI
ncbi:TolC family protein [Pelagicoccus sp. SDUM812002]|uniref:TolC family protein n=1 Tax=Pelagicoccus sp. SDUM812002 TaxID=3041266 RepID=UPI00280D8E39|nr:TolC family protein [Pelagicoccus sp. SDUM812002]MDQ8184170.1 TolC family protein [Pelagicoccus sp. SDUM812002]